MCLLVGFPHLRFVRLETDMRIAGVAHETEEDDVYNGYFIAKGTRILPLDW